MGKRPTGTVTFLFTDIEGSTQRWEKHPELMQRAFKRQESIIRESVAKHGGYTYKMVGDAFQIAFAAAPDALAAALAAQRALHAEAWGESGPIRVRMALHTGVTEERGDDQGHLGDYVGPVLNRTARLMAAGHGGQILLSQTTYDLVRDHLPPGISVRDLGEHFLKDLVRPEHIFQIVASDLPSAFPQLKTLDAHPHNLPAQLTSFIGREREMAEVRRLLNTTRLLTLLGSGGAGKTRLSLQVAADVLEKFADGVWRVELAALSDPALVPQAIASALSVREEQSRTILNTLTDDLKNKNLLLVLDNCEHLIEACAKLADTLLHACPNLKILATSREALGIAGETTFRVPSLSLPDPKNLPPVETLKQYEAIRLFIERALAVFSPFTLTHANAPAIAQICYRLDGIPLAIELAAARAKALKVEEIASRLDDRFRLLTGGSRTALPRHQTLRALMDWSYDLLSEKERVLLRRLSVFVGGWTLKAAEQVTSNASSAAHLLSPEEVLDLLTHLVEKSLVSVDEQGDETRYQMLETVRQYALAKLIESDEAEQVRGRHLEFFTDFAEKAELELAGAEQTIWFNRLELEHDNLRAALDWSQQSDRAAEIGLRLADALAQFWVIRGYLSEGRERISAALAHAQTLGRTALRGQALNGAAYLTYRQSDYPATRSFSEEALAIFRELGDKPGISEALSMLGNVATEEGDYETAPRLFEEGLALKRELKDGRGTARALLNLGWAALRPGDYALANTRLEEALALYHSAGDKNGTGMALSGLAEVALREGKLETASKLIEESLKLRREIGYKWGIGASLGTWAWIALRQRDWESAFARLKESVQVRKGIGDKGGIAWCLERLAEVAMGKQEIDKAVRIFGAAASLRAAMGSIIDPVDQPEYERNLASLRADLGEGTFDAVWAEGQVMTMEQAIEYATKDE